MNMIIFNSIFFKGLNLCVIWQYSEPDIIDL
jgi:hypothetical protein